MNLRLNAAAVLVLSICAFACKKDNYEEPTSMLSGRIVYNGEPIQVQYNDVPFQLFQYGFGKVGPIISTITPEGTYSHMLFDGEYKFVIALGQGPFLWPQTGGKEDSITINVNGNTTYDIEVRPYYMIRNPQLSGNSTSVTGTFALEKIITDANAKDIERATLYVNRTQFVDASNHIGTPTNLAGSAITDMANINMSVAVPAISPTQNHVFARIGVKIAGVEDQIFSPVQKITF